jgi:glycosyltransferase involved in cell wall biosynthesis
MVLFKSSSASRTNRSTCAVVAQIADAMRLVLTQPALAAELRARGLARAAQFTWERTARETIAVYERVLAGRGDGER